MKAHSGAQTLAGAGGLTGVESPGLVAWRNQLIFEQGRNGD
jgi:hypothetical protein